MFVEESELRGVVELEERIELYEDPLATSCNPWLSPPYKT